MINCPYCDEFENGPKYGDRILYESKNFVVFPALGQIVEGYLLIAPKKHYIAMGEIPSRLYSELSSVCEKVRKILSENYQKPLFFEHGPVSQTKRGGCCVDHAHFHAVPVNVDILDDLAKHFEYKEIKSFNELKKQFKKGAPYFYYESSSEEKYLFKIPEVVPSQYIRRLVAYKIGKPGRWDWRIYRGMDKLLRTVEKLKDKFM